MNAPLPPDSDRPGEPYSGEPYSGEPQTGQPNRSAPRSGELAAPATVRGHGPLDPCVLDWLADGELSPSELRCVVAALDRTPDEWRRCGLAFLESQALKQALGDDTRFESAFGPADRTPPPHGKAAVSANPASPLTASPATAETLPLEGVRTAIPAKPIRFEPTRWQLAATVLLSLSVGGWAGPRLGDWFDPPAAPEPGQTAAITIPGPVPGTQPQAPPGAGVEFVHMTVADDQQGERTIRVPVLPKADWTEAAPLLPQDDRARLEAAGHVVREQGLLMPVTLPDGRVVLVPVRQLHVGPVAPDAWQ